MFFSYKYFFIFLIILSLNFVNGVELDESSGDYIKSNESLFIGNNYNNYNVLVGVCPLM